MPVWGCEAGHYWTPSCLTLDTWKGQAELGGAAKKKAIPPTQANYGTSEEKSWWSHSVPPLCWAVSQDYVVTANTPGPSTLSLLSIIPHQRRPNGLLKSFQQPIRTRLLPFLVPGFPQASLLLPQGQNCLQELCWLRANDATVSLSSSWCSVFYSCVPLTGRLELVPDIAETPQD